MLHALFFCAFSPLPPQAMTLSDPFPAGATSTPSAMAMARWSKDAAYTRQEKQSAPCETNQRMSQTSRLNIDTERMTVFPTRRASLKSLSPVTR
jgi:hypothetical protein